MSGYTPLYDTMLTGTLYGKWPHTGIWACLLSRASREGVIDEVPQSLAAAIGVPVELLMQCISDFMKPDPGSRTKDHEGRRLAPLDPNREWGWKVLNHSKYREKARKKNFDQARTESGSDAERKHAEREAAHSNKSVPTRPAKSREVPLSESESKAIKKGADAPVFDPTTVSGLHLEAWRLWVEHRTKIKKPIREHSMRDAAEELAKLGSAQLAEVKRARAAGWQGIHPEKPTAQAPSKDPYANAI